MYYFAAWTDSGFFLGCSHEHETVAEADSCIPCAGGYVVAVEDGVMRSLTAEEEAEWQPVHYVSCTNNPAVPQQIEAAPQSRETKISRIEGETLVEFVLRILDARDPDQLAEPFPHVKHGFSDVKHRSVDPRLLPIESKDDSTCESDSQQTEETTSQLLLW
jgi:hypothetical protein